MGYSMDARQLGSDHPARVDSLPVTCCGGRTAASDERSSLPPGDSRIAGSRLTGAINFAGDTGNPSTGLVVAGNISTNDAAFLVAINSVNALIEKNTITVSGTVRSLNRVSGDATAVDCRDQSSGSLTAGTANTWLSNVGSDSNSTPSGIC
jgi:hypothetical protein